MTTVTLKINEKKKAGKTFLDLVEIFRGQKNAVEIVEEKSPYSTAFIEKVKRSQAEIKQGKYKTLNSKDVWGSLGL